MAVNGETVLVEQKISRLSITSESGSMKIEAESELSIEDKHCAQKWGFKVKDLYKLALRFYKEKEGKAVHLSYDDKLKLVAYTQQVVHGPFKAENLPPLGVFDVIGRDRRVAWQALGNMSQGDSMLAFINRLEELCPLFDSFVEANKRDLEEKERRLLEVKEREIVEAEQKALEEEMLKQQQEEQARQEFQRRQIQDALNQQTFQQFKAYAEQQYPDNPDQQAVLIRQLQDQHYHQYMQQLLQRPATMPNNRTALADDDVQNEKTQLLTNGANLDADESEDSQEYSPISAANMWTRKDIREFKDAIRREGGDSIIKVGHGETVTVRVPTHEDGTCLFWEFATDSYDLGFGVFFEWSKPESSQVSVHISESEDDEEDEEDEEDDEETLGDDLERGSGQEGQPGGRNLVARPPMSIVVPVYRRDCQEEVYAGSHTYPGAGVYLLKFDNSYSLWRSKTLYYRVYYTR
ncbi:Golgi resident protein GCP60 isoform X2 [Neocloeon triangulifer]|uniref:Golgi resident protein GCP60 isoform X2 n=1 Tax=Neocloeon triangulifer TaxID=2078957 RepID=UPI00286F866C|nr:Golgi resident protein GCP60 isoform X2 [Neocloeon triangulifer]